MMIRKELTACAETLHDLFALLGLDAGHDQSQGTTLREDYQLQGVNSKVVDMCGTF